MNAIQPYSNGMEAPNSIESEEALLGAIQMNAQAYAPVAAYLKLTHFFLVRHAHIWDAAGRVHQRGEEIDYISLMDELKAMGKLDEVGGAAYLMRLSNSCPNATHADTYGRMIQRAAVRRQMLISSDVIRNVALSNEHNVDEARAEMARQTAAVMGVELENREMSLADILREQMDFIEQRMKNPTTLLGLPTGYRDLDKMLAGLNKSDFIVLAGVPGMGKTSFMLSIAIYQARLGKHVGFVSQEMGKRQIVDRLIALETGINLQRIRTAQLTLEEWSLYVEAVDRVSNLPLYIHDGTVTPPILRAKAMTWASKKGLDILMMDYLQIMSSDGLFKPAQRPQEVGYFARSTKALAKEMSIPVLSAAQLNREVTERPQLRNLRDSGEIEQEADVVMFIYRDDYYHDDSQVPGLAEIIVEKQRNGPTGTVELYFEKTTTKFIDGTSAPIDLSGGVR